MTSTYANVIDLKIEEFSHISSPIACHSQVPITHSSQPAHFQSTTSVYTFAIMGLQETFTLNTGAKIPAVGFGTWQAAPKEVETAVETALKCGYTHIDCAAIYRNEQEVGAGIKKSGVDRKDIFITTKLWNSRHEPEKVEAALDESLRDLGLEYCDLYLMHWPT